MFIVSNENLIDKSIGSTENDSWSVGIYIAIGLIVLGVLYWFFKGPTGPEKKIVIKINGFDIEFDSNSLCINHNNKNIHVIKSDENIRNLLKRNVSDKKREESIREIIHKYFSKTYLNSIKRYIHIIDLNDDQECDIGSCERPYIYSNINFLINQLRPFYDLCDNDTKVAYDNLVDLYSKIQLFEHGDWQIMRFNGFCVILYNDRALERHEDADSEDCHYSFEDDGKTDLEALLTIKLSEMCIKNCDKILKIAEDLGKDIKIENAFDVKYGRYNKFYSNNQVNLFNILCNNTQEFIDIVEKDFGILNENAKKKVNDIKNILNEFQVTEDASVDKLKIVFLKFRLFRICKISANSKAIDEFYTKSLGKNGEVVESGEISYMMNNRRNYVEFAANNRGNYVKFVYVDNIEDLKTQTLKYILNYEFDRIFKSIDEKNASLNGQRYDHAIRECNKFIDKKIRWVGFDLFVCGMIVNKSDDAKHNFKEFVERISGANIRFKSVDKWEYDARRKSELFLEQLRNFNYGAPIKR